MTTGQGATARVIPRRLVVWWGRAIDSVVMLFFAGALVLVAAAVCEAIATSLPGVRSTTGPAMLLVPVLMGLGSAIGGVAITAARVVSPGPRLLRRMWGRSRVLWRRLLGPVLGLAFLSGRRLLVALAMGAVSGAATLMIALAVIRIPALAATLNGPDARTDALTDAPLWSQATYLAIHAPLPEELLYRAPVMAIAAIVIAITSRRRVRVAVIAMALIVISVVFGLAHLEWSLANAVTATISGLVFGLVSVLTRTLWAGVAAHATFNALAVLV